MATTADLRSAFEARVKEGIPNPPGEFHPVDLERVRDERYLTRILVHVDNDLKKASDMLWNLMLWRKTVGASDINENTIKMDYMKQGSFFPRGRDIDGCLLFVIKLKTHTKGERDLDEIKKIIIYWLDRIERAENGKLISLFFDMDGCGLANMDMDLIKYLIEMFDSYYPNFLNYIIIFQMPWILSAAFKVIKSLLPAKAQEIMKTCSKDNLKKVVTPEQALASWGGKDPYEFEFVPENRHSDHNAKHVTFAEQGDDNRTTVNTSNHSPGEMLSLNPNDIIVFKNENDEVSSQFTITNMDEKAVSFKIRTTAPEKFSVRPSSGTLSSGSSQTVHIAVQPGFKLLTITRDKFLVMSVHIPKTVLSPKELAKVWRNSTSSKVDEYRLKCQFSENLSDNNVLDDRSAEKHDSVTTTLKNLQLNYESLRCDVQKLNTLQYLTLFMTGVVVVLSFLVYHKTNSIEGYCVRM